ncbi:hypothetical protein ScalyP_jg7437 [Parmales sp. scaly parma]|nr:hypothetical protein ScalyP_jg7437 [Parmales sp. scaly parma]
MSCTIKQLEGTHGLDFNSTASVAKVKFYCCDKKRSQKKGQLVIVIKASHIFLYESPSSPGPRKCVNLLHMNVTFDVNNSKKVILSDSLSLPLYKFTFETDVDSSEFFKTCQRFIVTANSDAVKMRLGHSLVLSRHKSQLFAHEISTKMSDLDEDEAANVLDSLAEINTERYGF